MSGAAGTRRQRPTRSSCSKRSTTYLEGLRFAAEPGTGAAQQQKRRPSQYASTLSCSSTGSARQWSWKEALLALRLARPAGPRVESQGARRDLGATLPPRSAASSASTASAPRLVQPRPRAPRRDAVQPAVDSRRVLLSGQRPGSRSRTAGFLRRFHGFVDRHLRDVPGGCGVRRRATRRMLRSSGAMRWATRAWRAARSTRPARRARPQRPPRARG